MKLPFLFLCFFSFATLAQDFNYLPATDSVPDIILYKEFSLSYNQKHRQPDWVAYELTAEELAQRIKRSDYFAEDSRTGHSATLNDYRFSGYDRGHLCRAMYCKRSLSAYQESFLLSNISPQIGANFNRTGGIWHDLEQLEISIAQQHERIYAVSGPVFKHNLGVIGENKVTIPGYFYKAILLSNLQAAVGFIVRHEITDREPFAFAVPIDSLEAFTGIDFFPALGDSLENRLEAFVDHQYWRDQNRKPGFGNDTFPSRCKAILKSTGKRCKRKRGNGDGFCWQHK